MQAVGRACELSDVQHVVEPSAILEDPNGTGMKIELDLLMRDSAGMLVGIDATIGTWDKESDRVSHVRDKMYGRGTVAARVAAQEHVAATIRHTRREVAAKRMFPAVARGIEDKARWELKRAYKPGYKEATDRAGIEAHVLPITLSGGWHKEASGEIAAPRRAREVASAH